MQTKRINIYVYKDKSGMSKRNYINLEQWFFNLGCTLESPRELYKVLMPGSHPQRLPFNVCGVQPRH